MPDGRVPLLGHPSNYYLHSNCPQLAENMTSNTRQIVVDDTDLSIQYSGPWFQANGTNNNQGQGGNPFKNTLHGVNSYASFSSSFRGFGPHILATAGSQLTVFGSFDGATTSDEPRSNLDLLNRRSKARLDLVWTKTPSTKARPKYSIKFYMKAKKPLFVGYSGCTRRFLKAKS
ncbi:hypothetical protein GALMADRAFT_214016 [Galerina marginata CBS 339.88]|uniref:Uncharacterized protein n=1 Tax=Galerina marginata (strain CBS 339.88) TaxID=685588 RepID=A0A067SMX3_GALM3|nr:hypothetical protein GALMADRAFT_214016 [Galerina marginata CBS 339.88]